jgi:hypothetical protein
MQILNPSATFAMKLTYSLFRLSTHRQDDTQTTQATFNSGDRDALQFSSAPGELGARSEI